METGSASSAANCFAVRSSRARTNPEGPLVVWVVRGDRVMFATGQEAFSRQLYDGRAEGSFAGDALRCAQPKSHDTDRVTTARIRVLVMVFPSVVSRMFRPPNGSTFSGKPREPMLHRRNNLTRGLSAATFCWAASVVRRHFNRLLISP